MKNFFVLIMALMLCNAANAQLKIYEHLNQTGAAANCDRNTIYKGNAIPNGLNDKTSSIWLAKGFQAVLADNEDGTGNSFCYVAATSDLSENLSQETANKVSFIRVLPIDPKVQKKGACTKVNLEAKALGVTWYYDWGIGDYTYLDREYVPQAWNDAKTATDSVNLVRDKPSITSYLAYNEPDNVNGYSYIDSLNGEIKYRNLLRAGLRMGSPSPTQSQVYHWLWHFIDYANLNKSRIDVVGVHWYDWQYTSSSSKIPATAKQIFDRFTAYIDDVYAWYHKPIWITEFNACDWRTDSMQIEFMKLALPWLDNNPNVERYAYFFKIKQGSGNDKLFPAYKNGVLTSVGNAYKNHISKSAYPKNIVDTRSPPASLVAWNGGTGANNTNNATKNETISLEVYPSVSIDNKVQATFKEVADDAQIKIYNIMGQLVTTRNLQAGASSESIDLAHFTEGAYFLTLQDKGTVQTCKFIKQ